MFMKLAPSIFPIARNNAPRNNAELNRTRLVEYLPNPLVLVANIPITVTIARSASTTIKRDSVVIPFLLSTVLALHLTRLYFLSLGISLTGAHFVRLKKILSGVSVDFGIVFTSEQPPKEAFTW